MRAQSMRNGHAVLPANDERLETLRMWQRAVFFFAGGTRDRERSLRMEAELRVLQINHSVFQRGEPNDTRKLINRSYRQLSLEWHPDRNPHRIEEVR